MAPPTLALDAANASKPPGPDDGRRARVAGRAPGLLDDDDDDDDDDDAGEDGDDDEDEGGESGDDAAIAAAASVHDGEPLLGAVLAVLLPSLPLDDMVARARGLFGLGAGFFFFGPPPPPPSGEVGPSPAMGVWLVYAMAPKKSLPEPEPSSRSRVFGVSLGRTAGPDIVLSRALRPESSVRMCRYVSTKAMGTPRSSQ